jgi:hypothetical protein
MARPRKYDTGVRARTRELLASGATCEEAARSLREEFDPSPSVRWVAMVRAAALARRRPSAPRPPAPPPPPAPADAVEPDWDLVGETLEEQRELDLRRLHRNHPELLQPGPTQEGIAGREWAAGHRIDALMTLGHLTELCCAFRAEDVADVAEFLSEDPQPLPEGCFGAAVLARGQADRDRAIALLEGALTVLRARTLDERWISWAAETPAQRAERVAAVEARP